MENFVTLADIIDYRKEDSRKGIIFIQGNTEDRFVSYQELYRGALRVLYNLQQKGVTPKSELVFQVYDNEQYVYLFWACILGDIIPIPLTYATKDDARDKIFKVWNYLNSPYLAIDRISLEQFGADYADRIASIESNILYLEDLMISTQEGSIVKSSPEEIAYIQFSSGSTGDPKGVVLTHENVLANTKVVLETGNFNADGVWLSWMPLTHDMGLLGFHIMPTAAGGMQCTMTPADFIADPMIWLRRADQHRATVTCSPNFGYRYFLKNYQAEQAADWDLSSLRLIFNGAEPISIELCNTFLDKMSKHGLKRTTMFTVYGLSEATTSVAYPPYEQEFQYIGIDRDRTQFGKKICQVAPDDPKALLVANCGQALPGSPIRIADDQNNVIDDYRIGNIHISGPNVTPGYYNRPDKTREIITDDGWLNTEDLGFMIEGDLFVTGRAKDIIFINGTNYYSHDLEDFAQKVSGVGFGKAAVVGVRKPDNSEDIIVAFIVFKGDDLNVLLDLADQIRNAVSRQSGLTVSHVIPVERIPRTTSGKPQRFQLRQSFQKGAFDNILAQIESFKAQRSSRFSAPENATEKQIAELWQQLLEREDVGRRDNFFDIGGTSILAVELHLNLKKMFKQDFPLAMLYEHMTIAAMATYLNQNSAPLPHSPQAELDDVAAFEQMNLKRRQKRKALRRRSLHES